MRSKFFSEHDFIRNTFYCYWKMIDTHNAKFNVYRQKLNKYFPYISVYMIFYIIFETREAFP